MTQESKRKTQIALDWSIPLLLLVVATVYIRMSGVDLAFQSRFYDPDIGWIGGAQNPWLWLKHYGPLPAITITVVSLLVLIASFWVVRLRAYRYVALFFIAVMAVGPGLIVNAGFKQHWGRPRPLDLQEFNHDREFVEVWGAPVPGAGASFPSGHASVAFYLFTPFFVFRPHHRRWAMFFLALGLGYGMFMGLARISQGAHFISDVLWSAGFVYLTALAFFYLLRLDQRPLPSRSVAPKARVQYVGAAPPTP